MIFYKIVDAIKAVYEIRDYKVAIEDLVKAILRNECGSVPARELLSGREQLAAKLRDALDRDTEPWGIHVRLVELKGIDIAVQTG